MGSGPKIEESDFADKSEGITNATESHLNSKDHAIQRVATQNGDYANSSASADVGGLQEAKERTILDGTHNTIDTPSQANQPSVPNREQVNNQFLNAARDGDEKALVDTLGKADPNATTDFSETALHLACRYGHAAIVEKLLELELPKESIEARDWFGWTPLLSACSENHDGTLEILKALLKHQADIKAKGSGGQTALHYAYSYSSAAVIDFLLKQEGIDAKAQDEEGNTPLNLACRDCTTTEIEALWNLKSEANIGDKIGVNIPNKWNSTPLTRACQFQSAEVVKSLLEIGANFEISDNDGDSPLILASHFGTVEMVQAILDCKPHDQDYKSKYWSQRNKNDKSAFNSAMLNENAREEIISLLLSRGLQLIREDALELFSRETSKAVPGSHLNETLWLKIVRRVMLGFNSQSAQPLQETIEPIMEFASNEEKAFAILNANTLEHVQILNQLSRGLGLSGVICEMIWLDRHDPDGAQVSPHYLDLIKEFILSRDEWFKPKSDLVPKTPLQWSAFNGEYHLVWCLLKEMQSRDNEDVRKALEIAKARKQARSTKGRKGTVPTENEKENRMDSRQPGSVKASEKSSVDKEIRRYEYTIDILNNATSLVSIPKKQLILPDPSEIRGKENLLQQSTATIVSFYERDGQIDILRSTTNILELIYANDGKGVNAVLDIARLTFDEMTNNGLSKEKPNEKPQLRWIHLPANNMDWMEHLTLRIHKENHKNHDYSTSFMDLAQRSQNELPTDKSDVKFMKPICLREDDGTFVEDELRGSEKKSPRKTAVESSRLALYTPYVTFAYCYHEAERAESKKHKELSELYAKSILHGPRSLDRFYYNALSQPEMDKRDQSQVVTRGLLNLKMGEQLSKDRKRWPYLTVDQLWVWVIDEETIITSSTHREDDSDTLLVEKVCADLLQASKDGFREKLPSTVTEMSHFLVSTSVDFINNLTWGDICGVNHEGFSEDARLKPILLWYTDSINAAAVREKQLFDSFMKRTAPATEEIERAIAVAEEKEGQDTTTTPADDPISKFRHQEKDKKDWEAIHNAAKLLDEVKDLQDELVILRFLVTQQERVWVGMMGRDLDKDDARSPNFTGHELDAMIQITDTVQNSIKDLLNLNLVDKSAEQSQALVDLAKKADDQSKENARQGKILYAFGFVTVVFTPLSFLSSLLAINTTSSRHNDDGELEYETALMYSIIFGVSAVVVAPFMFHAFFFDVVKKRFDKLIAALPSFGTHGESIDQGNVTSAGEDRRPKNNPSRAMEEGRTAGGTEPQNTQSRSLLAG